MQIRKMKTDILDHPAFEGIGGAKPLDITADATTSGREALHPLQRASFQTYFDNASGRHPVGRPSVFPTLENVLSHGRFPVANFPVLQNVFSHGRSKAPFDQEAFTRALAATGEYRAAGNFWWQNLDDELEQADVPISSKRIASLMSHYFSKPAAMPDVVTVALKTGEEPGSQGRLHVISPVEFSHAFIMAIHRDLQNNDEPVLKQWRQFMLMTSFRFRVYDSEDARHYASKQIREDFKGQ